MRLTDSRLTGGVIFVAAAAFTALYVAAGGGNFPLDDSWIHQTYGRNLGLYGEWAYLRGTPSAASTSPFYTLILAAGYALNVPFRWWAHGIGALVLFVAGVSAAELAWQWRAAADRSPASHGQRPVSADPSGGAATRREQRRAAADDSGANLTGREQRPAAARMLQQSRFLPLITGLAVVGSWHLVWAAASGMETMLFGMFTLLLIWLAWRELDGRSDAVRAVALRGAVFGAAAGLATLTRPEGVLLVGMVGLALLVARPNMTWRTIILWGGAALVVFLVVLAPYLIYNLRLTGGLLPNTAAAKRAESIYFLQAPLLERVIRVARPLLAGGQVLLIPGMAAFVVALVARARGGGWRTALLVALLPAWGAALILLYAVTLPLEYQHGRYVIPALPALIVAGVLGTAWLLRRARASLVGRVLTRVLAISTALVFAVMLLGIGLQAYARDVRIIDEEMVATAFWLRDNIPPEDLLVTHDIGAVGYFAPRPILDIAGLVSPEVIPLISDPAALWALMQERGGVYLMALDNQIPGGDVNDPRLCEVFNTHGQTAPGGGPGASNMRVYRLAWDAAC